MDQQEKQREERRLEREAKRGAEREARAREAEMIERRAQRQHELEMKRLSLCRRMTPPAATYSARSPKLSNFVDGKEGLITGFYASKGLLLLATGIERNGRTH